jgi:hypothetical protein
MAGVIQEIDLVLSKVSLAKLEADLTAASKQIGTGLAAGATPAAVQFSKQLISTLQTRFASESGVLAKQLAEGSLSPAQYSAAATRLGKSISSDLKKGILSGGKLDLFGGEGGLALQNQLQGIGAVAPALEKIPIAASHAGAGLSHVRTAMFSVASQAAGVPGPIGSIVNGLLLFSGGGMLALGVAAGLGGMALGLDLLTASARKGRKAADDLIESLKDLGKTPFEILLGKIKDASKDIADTEKRIKEMDAFRARIQTQGTLPAAIAASMEGGGGLILTEKVYQEEVKRLDGLRDKLRLLRNEAAGTVGGSPVEVEQRGLGFLQGVGDQARKDEDEATRKRKEAAAERKRQIEENTRLLEKEAQRQLQIADDQRSISAEAQHALADLTTSTIDNLQLQIEEFETRVIAAFGHITPEAQKVIDAWKEQLAQAKILEPLNKSMQDFDTQIRHQDFSVIKLDKSWEKVGDTIAGVAQGILDMGRGLGIVDDQMSKVLQGAIGVGKNLAKALKGDPTAILGVAGGVVSIVGGVFGFHKSKDPERFAQNQAWYEAAIGGDANALEQLRIHSTVASPGHPGWGSGPAAADAAAKYQQAKAIVDAAAAPGKAKDAADAAAQAERDRLEAIRSGEEQQVAARTESERRAHISDLLGGGGPTDLANKLDELEKEFERLVAASPLGEDSPLARDAKSRADDAARELERAIDAAKSEAERVAGDKITPGYTVQHTLTESSAGRIVGELTTHSVLLTQIRDLISGKGLGPAGGSVGLTGPVPVNVSIDGKLFATVMGAYMADSYQRSASLNGNAAMG